MSVRATTPISICIRDEPRSRSRRKMYPKIKSTFNILENPFEGMKMRNMWVMHKETNLLNCI